MQTSSEVCDAVTRFYERLSAGDVEGTGSTVMGDEEAFVIGTQRVGSGREARLESIRENAAMGVVFEAGPIRGWAEGRMGWAVDEPTIVLHDGTRLTTRMTAVLRHDEDGVFRLQHQHYSWAMPDEIAMGQAQAWRNQLGLAAV
jgi:ketosteroid isomerase-like protein